MAKRDPVFMDADPAAGVPSMSAQELRGILYGFQAGVFAGTEFKVTAGAGLSVDSAAGRAFVFPSAGGVTFPGLYYCVDDATENSAAFEGGPVPANASTNPRLDAVVLQVFDASLDGGSRREWVRSYVPGVAAPGVVLGGTLPTLPPSSLLLAEVLVPANNPTSIPSANIRDRRLWARGARWSAALATRTTTSTVYGGIDTVNAQPRIELSGKPVTFRLDGVLAKTSTNAYVVFDLLDNGVDVTGDVTTLMRTDVSYLGNLLTWTWTPSPGSHVLLPRWRVTSGGASYQSGLLSASEDLRASAVNS